MSHDLPGFSRSLSGLASHCLTLKIRSLFASGAQNNPAIPVRADRFHIELLAWKLANVRPASRP